jgi:hypothetical protein
MGLFADADAALNKLRSQTEVLAGQIEEVKAAELARPSAIAAGPRGLAFMNLRADVRKIEEMVDSFRKDLGQVKVEANVAATAAGAATQSGAASAPDGLDAFSQIRLLEEAMEDQFALVQTQLDSMGGGCPCVDGRCPCACSKSAPMREPPSSAKTCPAAATLDGKTDEFTDKAKDPWRAFHRDGSGRHGGGGGNGGGRPGGGGGGDDDEDEDNDDFFIGTPEGRGRKLAHQHEFGRLFEVKDAKFLPGFDGETKASLWGRKVSSY